MFLHLVDDEKFISGMITLFEQVDPGSHLFVRIISDKDTRQLKYIHQHTANVRQVLFNSSEYSELIANLEQYTAVLIHGFFRPYHVHLANAAPENAVLVWFFWGGEIWTIPRFRKRVLLPLTRGLYYKNRIAPWLRANWRKYTVLFGANRSGYKYFTRDAPVIQPFNFDIVQAIKRVDYIVPVLDEDFQLLQRLIPCKARRLEWHYSSYPEPLADMDNRSITADNWLVGNSAHYSNNHVELFLRIRKIKGHSGKIIVPLTYGDAEYRQDILKIGPKLLKDRFYPLTEFQPYHAYMDLLCGCSAAFFNSCRQQAMGNILPLLYRGARVFLREDNPAYHFLAEKHITVFSIQKDIPADAKYLAEALTAEQVEKNRQAIDMLVTKTVLENKTRKLLEYLRRTDKPKKA